MLRLLAVLALLASCDRKTESGIEIVVDGTSAGRIAPAARTPLAAAVPTTVPDDAEWSTVVARGEGGTLDVPFDKSPNAELYIYRHTDGQPAFGLFAGTQAQRALVGVDRIEITTRTRAMDGTAKLEIRGVRTVTLESLASLPTVKWGRQRNSRAWRLRDVLGTAGAIRIVSADEPRDVTAEELDSLVIKATGDNKFQLKKTSPAGATEWRVHDVRMIEIR